MQIVTNQFQKELKQHGSNDFPILVSHERLSEYESGSFMWHWHPEIEITYVQKGQMLYKVNQQEFYMNTGDMLFGNSNTLHAGCMLSDTDISYNDCEYISITFSPKLVYGFYESSIYKKYVEPLIQDFKTPAIHIDFSKEWHNQFADLTRQIITIYENKENFYEFEICIKLQMLWKVILENLSASENSCTYNRRDYERIREIMNYVEQNFDKAISLKSISEHIHLCESECSRLFKRCMNISLFSFLQEYRIERSLEYLADKKESISDVAQKCGFSDSNCYAKVFTKIKGISPSLYRRGLTP